MSLNLVSLILASVALSATAQITFKFGTTALGPSIRSAHGPLSTQVALPIATGLGLYAIGTVLWLAVLSRVELSQAYPVRWPRLRADDASWWLFGDTLSAQGLIGISLVVGGIVLVAAS